VRLDTLIRAAGRAAVLAGVLRAAASFVSGGSELQRQALYLLIDLLLVLSVFASYARHHEATGRTGAAGFVTAVVGILLVRSSRAFPGVDLYPAGALLVAVGWVVLTAAWWRTANGVAWVPALFALSIAAGVAGQFAPALFVASGVIFGAAMIGVGREMLR
jgi:hypothetical protein